MYLTQYIFWSVFTASLFVNIVFGITLNGLIVLMNCKTWRKNKSLPTGDKIVTSLCLSRSIFQCVSAIYHIFRMTIPSMISHGYVGAFCALVQTIIDYISLWLASLLCVYYCVKIANYNHAVFRYLKARMNTLVPWLMGLCVFVSSVLSVPRCWYVFSYNSKAVTMGVFPNLTQPMENSYIYIIGVSPAFVIFSIGFFLSVPSLCRHIRNMSNAGTGFRTPNLTIHYNAIKNMVAFFLLYFAYIACVGIKVSRVLVTEPLYDVLVSLLASFYPFLHSVMIIFYNTKLKKECLSLLTCVLRFAQKKVITNPLGQD